MSDAFIANCGYGGGEMYTKLVTSSGTSQAIQIDGPDLMITVKTAAIYWRWGQVDDTVSVATAATQGSWLPINAVVRLGKPNNATHIHIIQDTSAATVHLTSGYGI